MVLQTSTALPGRLPSEIAHCGGIRMIRRLRVLLAGLLLFTIGLIYYNSDSLWGLPLSNDQIPLKIVNSHHESKAGNLSTKPGVRSYDISGLVSKSAVSANGLNSYQRQYPACPIPQLEPYHKSIQVYVNNGELPLMFNCKENYTLLFKSTLQSTIIPVKWPDYFQDEGYESCCYRTVSRDEYLVNRKPIDRGLLYKHVQNSSGVDPQCLPISLTTETKIPDGHEFIAIFCKRKSYQDEALVDAHSFVHLNLSSTENNSEEMEEKFNVVIFGMGGMSRMNFLRTMPQSYTFLKNELEAVEMFGYNKVGEDTLPNIMAMLMGEWPCNLNFDFEDCPFIWKDYSEQDYYTMFSEDGSTSLFNEMGLGFKRKPTDYYLRPFSHFADANFKTDACYGPRLTFEYLLNSMEKFVDTMSRNKKNFFGFTWGTGMTHSYLNAPRLGDPYLLKSLRWLKKSGHLKNTIFILMSDQGIRLNAIRNTIQGQLEERLPLLYFVLPQSFKIKYRMATSNFLYNTDRLITTYDLHETLKDILNLDMIENGKLSEREGDLLSLRRNLTQGISLFLPIPEFRTCQMAGIITNFCSCNYMEVVNVADPGINAFAKAEIAVFHINSILGSNITNATNCAILELQYVTMVRRVGFSNDSLWSGYMINLETRPGEGQFEALVAKERDSKLWTVQGPIDRTNLYGNQSYCVQDIIKLKPYCYCLEDSSS